MALLFVDACPRGPESRTLALAKAYLCERAAPVDTARLAQLRLTPLDGEAINAREALLGARQFDDPRFALARQFAQADELVIAAPYWDLSFPASLKVYLEHVFARGITFVYAEEGPVGLCRARRATFLTSSGGSLGALNLGGDYLRGVLRALAGVPEFVQISAEGLDIAGLDANAILADAKARARQAAKRAEQAAR